MRAHTVSHVMDTLDTSNNLPLQQKNPFGTTTSFQYTAEASKVDLHQNKKPYELLKPSH